VGLSSDEAAACCIGKHMTQIVICIATSLARREVRAIAGTLSRLAATPARGRSGTIRRGRAGLPRHGTDEPANAGATKRRRMDRKRLRSPSPSSIPSITIFVRLPNHKWMSDRGRPGGSSLLAMAVSR
jgi:plasmid stabilization system protein ParE